MKYMLMGQLLILSTLAFGGDKPASCELGSKSIVSRSSSGLAQVSNLGIIEVTCRVPARPFPTKPGGPGRLGLKIATVTYQISPDGSKKQVPSEGHPTGGGFGPDPQPEEVYFYLQIPLVPSERDDEARRFLTRIFENPMAPREITEEAQQRALERARKFVYQHRVGHFQVECRVLDGDRVWGIGVVELEVLFKGRFSDFGLPGSPPV
jgi:hypothetical protein